MNTGASFLHVDAKSLLKGAMAGMTGGARTTIVASRGFVGASAYLVSEREKRKIENDARSGSTRSLYEISPHP
jgi:hypothetical protein